MIVSPSASCVGMVREQYPRAAAQWEDAALAQAVAALVPRVYELSEFLVKKLGVTDVGAYFPHRVTYHPTCHALRGLHVGDMPLQLLQAVRGIDLVELPDAAECCGFGGTFAIKNADTSLAMLGDKVRAILTTRAEVCCAADTSCLMHIGGALSRQRAGVRVLHLAEILAVNRGGAMFDGTQRQATCQRFRTAQSRRWQTRSCAATWAKPPAPSAPSAPTSLESWPIGRRCAKQAEQSKRRRCATSTTISCN